MRSSIFYVLALCAAATVFAADRAPWKLSVEERAALRFGAAARAERMGSGQVDHIDGRKNPELFLPTELFEGLVLDAFVLDTAIVNYAVVNSDDLFRSQDEWDEFAKLAARYVTWFGRERAVVNELKGCSGAERVALEAKLAEVVRQKRSAGSEALRKARAHFGPERFDRFLYTVIAPTRSKTIVRESADLVRELIAYEKEAQ